MKITPRDVPLDLPVVRCPIPYNRDGACSFLQKSRMRRPLELLAGRRTKAQNKAQSLLPEGPRANPRLTWKPTKLPKTARVVTLSDVKILHNGAKVPRRMARRGWNASAVGALGGRVETYSHFNAKRRLRVKTTAFETWEDSCRSGTATPAMLHVARSFSA